MKVKTNVKSGVEWVCHYHPTKTINGQRVGDCCPTPIVYSGGVWTFRDLGESGVRWDDKGMCGLANYIPAGPYFPWMPDFPRPFG